MTKLERCVGVCLVLAAIGCSGSGDTDGRTTDGTRGGPSAFPGAAGSFSNPTQPAFGTGIGGAPGLAPVTKSTMPTTLDGDTCAGASVRASRVTPTVYLVIDGSSSMNAVFGGSGTRWQVLREALVG